MSRNQWILLALAALLVVGVFAMPKLIEWFVGGALAGGAALVGAKRRRRKADADHQQNVAEETQKVEDLQKESDKLVESASVRAESSPQDAVKDLSIDERRARLEKVAGKLK
jgi:predicted dinucleotide-utilizing enzyme